MDTKILKLLFLVVNRNTLVSMHGLVVASRSMAWWQKVRLGRLLTHSKQQGESLRHTQSQ